MHMEHAFREAFVWHMETTGTTIAEIVSSTGVSRDVINKLNARPESSTTAENALLIASYFGKTVNQFMARETVSQADRLKTLLGLLGPKELQLLTAQVEGLARRLPRQ